MSKPPSDMIGWRRFYDTLLGLGMPYRWTLGSKTSAILAQLHDPLVGSDHIGKTLLDGSYRYGDEEHRLNEVGGRYLGQKANAKGPLSIQPSLEWQASWHGFSWLRDILRLEQKDAIAAARGHILTWNIAPSRHIAWRADVVARRIQFWLSYHHQLELSDKSLALLITRIAYHIRHLQRVRTSTSHDHRRFAIHTALLCASICLPALCPAQEKLTLKALEQDLKKYVDSKGCHKSRSPGRQAEVLGDLLTIQATLMIGCRQVPTLLTETIERMRYILKLWQHPDQGLALFHESFESNPDLIRILTKGDTSNTSSSNTDNVEIAGFYRLNHGLMTAIIDTGPPDGLGSSNGYERLHASTASFELSVGSERLIVNCGTSVDNDWRRHMRSTAAHSTLVINDTNSENFDPNNYCLESTHSYRKRDDASWLDMEHSGYLCDYHLSHRRRFYLDNSSLRGEDVIVEQMAEPKNNVDIRFHIHPDVNPSLMPGSNTVILQTTQSGSWALRIDGGSLQLASGVYLGRGRKEMAHHILVHATPLSYPFRLAWAIYPFG